MYLFLLPWAESLVDNIDNCCLFARCHEGMIFAGPSYRTICQADGRWSHPVPRCYGEQILYYCMTCQGVHRPLIDWTRTAEAFTDLELLICRREYNERRSQKSLHSNLEQALCSQVFEQFKVK
jgi:hypothetical protein